MKREHRKIVTIFKAIESVQMAFGDAIDSLVNPPKKPKRKMKGCQYVGTGSRRRCGKRAGPRTRWLCKDHR